MHLFIEVGEYRCSPVTSTSGNDESQCALFDSQSSSQARPPVVIMVNYGDGSGEQVRKVRGRVQVWTREDPRDLWTHKYQLPGRYWVSVSSRRPHMSTYVLPAAINELDWTSDAAWLEVEVVEPVTDNMGMEVITSSS